MPNPDRILVALSGGVDSAVTVRILQQQGFAVQAAVIRFSPAHDKAVLAAQTAAGELGVPLSVLHGEELFEEAVIQPFCQMYAAGRTPSPCILCNPCVKFHLLAQEADRLGIPFIASGHYARCEEREGIHHIAKAQSAARDQSYMLYRLPQKILSRLCLPLGEFEKTEIREMAAAFGLSSADTPDSQEICFIPDGNYPAYIAQKGVADKPGRFIGPEGQDLGPHRGVMHYTVGQRKGLGLALGKPVFVKEINPAGDVVLALAGGEYAAAVVIGRLHTTSGQPLQAGQRYDVKIRSAAKPVPCRVESTAENSARLVFETPQRAIAPGQHAVLYEGPFVMGGGEMQASF